MKAPVFLLAFILCGFAATASAATLVVTKTADTNDGVCDADCSLREAVAVANAADTVVFSSLFNTPQTIASMLGPIAITRNLTITGNGRDLLTVSGNSASRIFRISGTVTVNLSGMKLTNGLTDPIDPSGGAIYIANSSLNITSVNIANNIAQGIGQNMYGYGGGIYMDHSHLTVVDSSISNNRANVSNAGDGGGGAIYSRFGNITVTGSHLDRNSYQAIYQRGSSSIPGVVSVVDSTIDNNGNALLNDSDSGSITLIGSTVRNNGGGVGGGGGTSTLMIDRAIISDNQPGRAIGNNGMAIVTNTTINNNFANGIGASGGGIRNLGTMWVLNSSITNNRAFESGGGIFNATGSLFLTNTTISGNFADDGGGQCDCPGGGIYSLWNPVNPNGVVILTNSTVTNNRAAGTGGGIRQDVGGSLIMRNTIVAGNTATTSAVDISGPAQSDGFNLIGNTTGSSGWIASDLLNRNPLLAPLGNNFGSGLTHAILPGSPAINAGNNDLARDPYDNSLLLYDQRGIGFARVVSGTVDIGAYEANYAAGPVTLSGRITTAGGRGIANVRVTLTNGNAVIYAQTNPFGYYRFVDLTPGTTVTVRVSHKYYQFDPPEVVITIDQPRNDLTFVAQGP